MPAIPARLEKAPEPEFAEYVKSYPYEVEFCGRMKGESSRSDFSRAMKFIVATGSATADTLPAEKLPQNDRNIRARLPKFPGRNCRFSALQPDTAVRFIECR